MEYFACGEQGAVATRPQGDNDNGEYVGKPSNNKQSEEAFTIACSFTHRRDPFLVRETRESITATFSVIGYVHSLYNHFPIFSYFSSENITLLCKTVQRISPNGHRLPGVTYDLWSAPELMHNSELQEINIQI